MYHRPFKGISFVAEMGKDGFSSDSQISVKGKKSNLQWFYDYTY